MSFLDYGNEQAEIKIAERGEYEVEVLGVRHEEGQYPRLSVRLQVVDDELIDDIYHNLWLPNDEDSLKQKAKKIATLRGFVEAFGVPWQGGFDTEGLLGQRGRVMLDIQPADTERGYDARNRVVQVIKAR